MQISLLLHPNVVQEALIQECRIARVSDAIDGSIVDATEQELIALLQASLYVVLLRSQC
jgi:hypothetical protein